MINLPEYVVMGNVFKCRDSSICFPSYDKFMINLPEYVVMGNVFKCIDSSICFPSYDKFT